jgi:hypothetical protein
VLYVDVLKQVLKADPTKIELLKKLRDHGLKSSRIGAGFVRNAVWDCHSLKTPVSHFDIDVIYFEPIHSSSAPDLIFENQLRLVAPDQKWSVKN